MFVFMAVSQRQYIIYKLNLHSSQTSRKTLKKRVIVETKLSINVKIKNTFNYDKC